MISEGLEAFRAQEPTPAQIRAAITFNSDACKRYGRYWKHYDATHAEINELLKDLELAENRCLTGPEPAR